MYGVRDLGFLTPDFLGVLPNPQDTLGKPYEPIRDALVAAFNNEPLMPTYAKVHAPAKYLLQAKAALKELLTAADLELILDHRSVPRLWAANRALQGTNVERFMNGLAIEEWDVGDFLEFVSDQGGSRWSAPEASFMSWLGDKPVEWFQQFYALLAQPDTDDELYQLKESKISKLIDGKLGVAAHSYFLDEDRRYAHIVPCVDPAVYEYGKSKVQQKFARKFLEEVGVKEVGEQELVKSLLDKEYSKENHALDEKNYVAHLRRFIKFIESDVTARGILANYKIFLGSDGKWHKPSEIFLDRPFVDTGLTDYYEVIGDSGGLSSLASFYDSLPIDIPKVVSLAKSLGAIATIKIANANCMNNPRWSYLSSVYGQRSTSPINNDYVIKHFDKIIAAKSVRIARLIWDSLNSYGHNPTWLEARYRKNATGGSKYADSQVIHQLREAEWIPQAGEFVKPSQARADLLPEGFIYDPGIAWLKKVEFGKAIDLQNEQMRQAAEEAAARQSRKSTAAAEFGFESPEDIARLEKLSKVPAEELERLIADWERSQIPIELPENEPRNPERRAQKVGALASNAPERTTEMRTRSVSVGRDGVKDEAGQYLRQQYTREGDLFCQICKRPMPFRLDDGTQYFERVEFLPQLKNRYHQNYLALCPNHAAMFKFANGTDELLLELFLDLTGNELEVILAQNDETIHFTKTHIVDLQQVIEVDRDSFDDGTTVAN